MSEQEKKELMLMMFLITQELETTQIVFLPEVLKFEDSIIRLNQGITLLKYSSYIDCIIKKIKMKRVEIKETDNRDISITDLILDNNTVVEVDVIDLFENMLENSGNEEVLDMFYVLIEKLKQD